MGYLVLAFYLLKEIDEPRREIKNWKRFLKEKDALGRIYINEKGINAQMSISEKDASDFYKWFMGDERYKGTEIKVHHYPEQAFPKLTIKYRVQLVAMDRDYDLSHEGKHLSSDEWAKMIEKRDENTVIVDVRNDYEWEVGHFEGAEKPQLKTFREFPKYAEELKKTHDPKKTKVMMYCTGGIRCELYSCLVKDQGFEEVYQLDGGIIKYGLEKGNKYWKGNLFVFDDRLVVSISDKEKSAVISHCCHCDTTVDTYYNCANMDCNELFISCKSCAEEMRGCCKESCMDAPRARSFQVSDHPKPFRKLPFEEKVKLIRRSV
ncbi:MAG: rhodanese-related sulfurtransferase [Candidatus Neptunochlamydia sp.]|nr:rhodanese-related sulfurtransferase [Candidatus Neptunochlamydia sp.]